ncbi:MAG: alpha/beta fold hydrolase [Oscillatoriales cyanobacterium]|jgi:pimeloyl-ACP methyl ester carboxylesterase|uniref:alpha/beta fold hydrolase n=1 Tax=unclassified Microcoleus TaxID=2642155 RepID=UPI001D64C7E1|nr:MULTISPECIES: alpha/beta fold hydrolase [unclassified Microcoleus]TAE98136.1 MAG: alpha/beta fold hydrolase [Oscillatoriales cyanobacterium]MCC3462742.1 alpha/beta fold hydrolase [Microcoleus sp. PH2017_11_PCY_U_A]MCC3481195.1 alpha/beta fold hydrolase [Microcoleus sp. PH2017_12_PCY_D_A]MCC3527659.1 alpha/beta fold hydrolase [Microcoleus sp. PH2017_21_RUC_O_A]MCC3539761.1 alpha/beta fold hydrolase [Microcoleus sp. PH2017_22_RUC_O_B]
MKNVYNKIKLPEDQYIRVGVIKTRYWSAGTKGSPLILLHGGGSSIEVWTYNFDALAQNHQVYAFDMVGSGLSDKPELPYSLDYQVQFLTDFMNALNIDKANIIANSMGGGIILKFALKYPERIGKIVLISSLGLGKEISIYHRFLAAVPVIAKFAQPSRFGAKLMLKKNVYNPKAIPSEWVENSFQRFKMPGRKQALISILKTNLNLGGVREEVFMPIVQQLAHIRAPTLIIWGNQDAVLPVTHAHIANKYIPNTSLHIFDKCGHWPHVEYPQKFNQLVLKFLH